MKRFAFLLLLFSLLLPACGLPAAPPAISAVAPATSTPVPSTVTPSPPATLVPTLTPTPTITPSPTATPGSLWVEDTTCYFTDNPNERYWCFVIEVFGQQCYLEDPKSNSVDDKSYQILEDAGFVFSQSISPEERGSYMRTFNMWGAEEVSDRYGMCYLGNEYLPGAEPDEQTKLVFVREPDLAIVWTWIRESAQTPTP